MKNEEYFNFVMICASMKWVGNSGDWRWLKGKEEDQLKEK